MKLTCAAVRDRLAPYHDGELPIEGQVAVQGHLLQCVDCAEELRELTILSGILRATSASVVNQVSHELEGVQAGVLSRLKAEQEQSLQSRVGRAFEDFHLVWTALGATAATLACVTIALGILYYGPRAERPDSLSALVTALGSPAGSNANPVSVDGRMLLPRPAPDDESFLIALDRNSEGDDAVLALYAVLTKEGRVQSFELLAGHGLDDRMSRELLKAVSEARFEPARWGGAPVAVNMVWLLATTTVRAYDPQRRGRTTTQDLTRGFGGYLV
jgi:hypothetical protein